MASQAFQYSMSASAATNVPSSSFVGDGMHDSSLLNNDCSDWADNGADIGTQVDPTLNDVNADTSMPVAAFVTAKMALQASTDAAIKSDIVSTPITSSPAAPGLTPQNISASKQTPADGTQSSVPMSQFMCGIPARAAPAAGGGVVVGGDDGGMP